MVSQVRPHFKSQVVWDIKPQMSTALKSSDTGPPAACLSSPESDVFAQV